MRGTRVMATAIHRAVLVLERSVSSVMAVTSSQMVGLFRLSVYQAEPGFSGRSGEDQHAETMSPAYGSHHGLRQRKAEIVFSYHHDRILAGPNAAAAHPGRGRQAPDQPGLEGRTRI